MSSVNSYRAAVTTSHSLIGSTDWECLATRLSFLPHWYSTPLFVRRTQYRSYILCSHSLFSVTPLFFVSSLTILVILHSVHYCRHGRIIWFLIPTFCLLSHLWLVFEFCITGKSWKDSFCGSVFSLSSLQWISNRRKRRYWKERGHQMKTRFEGPWFRIQTSAGPLRGNTSPSSTNLEYLQPSVSVILPLFRQTLTFLAFGFQR